MDPWRGPAEPVKSLGGALSRRGVICVDRENQDSRVSSQDWVVYFCLWLILGCWSASFCICISMDGTNRTT